MVPKINFVFYRKGSAEPISLNHYGRSCDVTRFMWCVFLGYFFIPQDSMFMWAALLHTYWDWVSMLMLMLLERIIHFVFVFRMLLPFLFFIHVRQS